MSKVRRTIGKLITIMFMLCVCQCARMCGSNDMFVVEGGFFRSNSKSQARSEHSSRASCRPASPCALDIYMCVQYICANDMINAMARVLCRMCRMCDEIIKV